MWKDQRLNFRIDKNEKSDFDKCLKILIEKKKREGMYYVPNKTDLLNELVQHFLKVHNKKK